MKAIPAHLHRGPSRSGPAGIGPTATIDRALALLAAGGFEYESVDRCPAPCCFCDPALIPAA